MTNFFIAIWGKLRVYTTMEKKGTQNLSKGVRNSEGNVAA